LGGDVLLQRGAEGGQVEVAVDAANWLLASTMPAAHQRRAIWPSRQRLTNRRLADRVRANTRRDSGT